MDDLREDAVLATGLTFFCEDRDALLAADASTGMPLWQFRANQNLEGVAYELHV